MAYIFAGKKSLCLLRNYHICQHFKNHQSLLEISLTEPGIKAKTSQRVCAFSVISYWYSFLTGIHFLPTCLTQGDV